MLLTVRRLEPRELDFNNLMLYGTSTIIGNAICRAMSLEVWIQVQERDILAV
jgi:hypothetical protein